MINFMLKTVAFIFLLIMFLIVITGGLWVLRVMVYWWLDIDYVFTQNFPANLLEESQIASNLTGVISKETQMKVLSIVDNPKAEIERLEEENGTVTENSEN